MVIDGLKVITNHGKTGVLKMASTAAAKRDKRRGHTIGINSGKGVSETWSALFRSNHKAKKTDSQLLVMMRAEFPKRKTFQPVGRIRNFFNRGVQGYGIEGKKLKGTQAESFAYDKKGKVTANADWGRDRKKNPKKQKAAKLRALKVWAKRSRKGKSKPAAKKKTASERIATIVKKEMAKKKKPAKIAKATLKTPAGKKIKLKIHKKAA